MENRADTEIRIWFFNLSFGWVQYDTTRHWMDAQRIEDRIFELGYPAVRVSWINQGNGERYYRTSSRTINIGERNFEPEWSYTES